VIAEFPAQSLRFFGDVWVFSDFALFVIDPIMSWNLRFVPATIADVKDLSSTGFFGFGPSTPRQFCVPHRHCCMFFWEKGLSRLVCVLSRGEFPNSLEIVVVGKFIARHDAYRTSKQGHPGFAINSPLDHLAIRFTRMVHKPSNGTASGINDHLVVETH
jgi:hypothetical protein